MGSICKIWKEDGRLFATHFFTNSSSLVTLSTAYFLEKNLDAHQVISMLSCFLADKECTYFHILVDLNFSNWILWILGDFHHSNWFLGEKNLPSYFSNIAPGSIPSVTPEICDSQMNICQTGDRNKGDPKYILEVFKPIT